MIPKRRSFAALGLALTLAGCSMLLAPTPERSKFLVLTPITAPGPIVPVRSAAGKPLALGLGPITLPPYLDRPDVVMRTSRNTLEISPIDRWAEPLKENFRDVLAANLATLLGTERIVTFPWFANAKLGYAVRVDVEQFEVDANDGARLVAHWTINNPRTGATVDSRETDVSEPMSSHDAQAVAAGLSTALGDLSRQIAEALRRMRS